ncbi:MAG: hypothetical protein FJ030_16720 [Chloroflexi bacterium]|nr:hypothetical protein [Chloroflexota bacterium]
MNSLKPPSPVAADALAADDALADCFAFLLRQRAARLAAVIVNELPKEAGQDGAAEEASDDEQCE